MKKILLTMVTSIGLAVVGFFSYSQTTTQLQIGLRLYNSFSGYTNISSGEAFLWSGIRYTNHNPINLTISANTGTSYILSGDVLPNPTTGIETNPYIIQKSTTLTSGDGLKTIFPYLQKGLEVMVLPKLQIYLDTTPPSTPLLIGITGNLSIANNVIAQRNPSIDTGSGIKEYELIIANDSGFSNILYINSMNYNEILFNTNLIGTGQKYWIVTAKDRASNTSTSLIGNFCINPGCGTQTGQTILPPPSGGGGGGGGTTIRATLTENEQETIKEETLQLIPEPKINTLADRFYDQELIDAYIYAYQRGITTMPSIMKAQMKDKLLRKHLAKMVSVYATKIMNKVPDSTMICEHNDVDMEDIEMRYYIKLSCKLNLMGLEDNGIIPDKVFNPNQEVTRAEFGTVFSRLIYQGEYNIKLGETYLRYEKHLQALKQDLIMTKIDDPDIKELRGRVMLMMMRADKTYTQTHASAKTKTGNSLSK